MWLQSTGMRAYPALSKPRDRSLTRQLFRTGRRGVIGTGHPRRPEMLGRTTTARRLPSDEIPTAEGPEVEGEVRHQPGQPQELACRLPSWPRPASVRL
jgi:hypothetical protein